MESNENPRELFRLAVQHQQNGNYRQAIELFERVRAIEPQTEKLNLQLGKCYEKEGQLRKAIHAVSEELLRFPSQATFEYIKSLDEIRDGRVIGDFEFKQNQPPKEWPKISACLIVKNEAEALPGFFEKIRLVADEVVVVDTGSSDQTVEIAKSYGAVIAYFPWIGDFAAARNVSIEHANGDWILVLDPDEYVDKANAVRIKWAAVLAKADVYLFKVINEHTRADAYQEPVALGMRMFRRLPGLLYRNALHETVLDASIELGLTRANTNIELHHVGYDIAPADMRKKLERNAEIARRVSQQNPNDAFLKILDSLGRCTFDGAEAAAPYMEQALFSMPDKMPVIHYVVETYMHLIEYLAKAHQYDRLKRILDESMTDMHAVRSAMAYAGWLYLNCLGEAMWAAYCFRHALSLNERPLEESFILVITGAKLPSSENLVRLLVKALFIAGSVNDARQVYREHAVKSSRTPSNDDLAKARRWIDGGQADKVAEFLRPIAGAHGPSLVLLARAEMQLKLWDDVSFHLLAAGLFGGTPDFDWELLAAAELFDQNFYPALYYARQALKQNPHSPSAMNTIRTVENLTGLKA